MSPEQDQNCKPGWSRLWNWIGKKKTDVHSAGTETTAGSYGNAPEPGDVIGDYELLAEVGGNMGLVYRAQHLLLNKVVALKLLPARALADDTLRERFQREIRVLGQLQHEHLVAASDARHVETWFLVTMDWIDGIDLLRAVHNHGKLSVADACEAIRQAALGLQYAHEHRLVHRDIKPSNLMLTREGRLKVIDLGLALWGDDVSAHLTREDNVMGTFAYCAPEQFRNASQVDIRADIYSLGCTLFHLLTGRPPYGRGRTLTEIVQAHLNEPFPPLPEARPDAPAGLQAVIARMTAKDRENRYSTPREVVEAINPYSNASDLVKLVPPASRQGAPPPRPPKGNPGKPGHTGKASQPQVHFSRRAALLAGVPAAVGGFFLGRQFPSKDWVRTKTLDQKFARWQVLYDLLDDKLACFIGHLGTVSPNTKFLIYSRGTDRNWVSPGFQQGWVGEIETRFPALNTNRVFTMTITPAMGEKRASFKHEETAKIMGKKVSEILGLKPGTVTPKQVVFLMDTSSRKGVYDEENMGTANTNAEELRKVLSRELNGDPNVKVALSFQTFNISDKSSKRNWDGEETVLKEKPSLVLFHRSAFFHVVNAEVGLGYPVYESPDSDKPVAWEEWKE